MTLQFREPEPELITGATGEWEIIVGLEVHAQVSSQSKLFSSAPTDFGATPNSSVGFVDAAMPGMLPVVNEFCIEQAVRTGLGLNARINRYSVFDRKNYFYPDLPQGYQISQLYHPIVGEGEILVALAPGVARRVRVERIHLEQDAGKSLHDMHPELSYVDLNRTGIALMEIVSYPDIRSPREAAAYILKLRQIMRYLGTCDGNMQEGSLRADVNVSVRPADSKAYGTRCEIKNMNSTRFIQQAIASEARRQMALLEDGGDVAQETRLYDPDSGSTRSMRSKEDAQDYRYFPCPDLLPLELDQAWIDDIAATLPELPDEKKARLIDRYGITDYDAEVLVAERQHAEFFEQTAAGRNGKQVANWIINELFGRLNKENLTIATSPISAAQLGSIIDLIDEGVISGKIAKSLFDIVWREGGDPRRVATQRNMLQITDSRALEDAVDKVFVASPTQVERALTHSKVAGYLVGQVMKLTAGKADPRQVSQIVNKRLGDLRDQS